MNTVLEQVLIEFPKAEMVAYLVAHPEDFEEAISLAISDRQPYSWRAASLVGDCMEADDYRIREYIQDIINCLPTKQDGHQRELLKILLRMELDEEQEAFLFDHCLGIWSSIHKQPSVRMIAFRLIFKIVRKYPDLSREVTFLIQDHYVDSLSPGIKRCIIRMMKELNTNVGA